MIVVADTTPVNRNQVIYRSRVGNGVRQIVFKVFGGVGFHFVLFQETVEFEA